MAPSPWSWQAAWVELVAVAVLAVAYVLAARRRPPSRAQAACFAAALVALVALAVTPIATLANHYLLAAHLIQNVALAEWIPLLAVAGIPPALAAEIGRFRAIRLLTVPYVALPLWLVGYAAWHVPQPYDAALENHLLLHLEHLTYFVTGVLLWWCVVHARPWSLTWGEKSAYVFAAFVFASPLGLLLALLPSPLYDFYVAAPELWGLTPLADQQIAGIAMAVSESILFFAVFTYCFVRFMAEEDATVDSLG